MFSSLNLYYLKQLGITPWISKEYNPIENRKQDVAKVIVITKPESSHKAQILLKRMLACINLDKNELLVIANESNMSSVRWTKSPLAILALGISQEELLKEYKLNQTVLYSFSPDYLLENPSDKKHVLKVLNAINETVLAKADET